MNHDSVEFVVEHGDIKQTDADLLVLKLLDGGYGVGRQVAEEIEKYSPEFNRPSQGESVIWPTADAITANDVLYIGFKPITVEYRDIREFARHSLQVARNHAVHNQKSFSEIATTVHGPGFGLDESEAFESLIAGFVDAIQDDTIPPSLDTIRIVEIDEARAERLEDTLEQFLPDTAVSQNQARTQAAREVGYTSDSKPRAFIAMPFREEFEDVYQLGIRESMKSAGYLCERIDEEAFTGSIPEEIKNRIESASLVVADMTNANPNVYLEVGYAWGCDVDTLLLTQDTDDLKFDVQNYNTIVYDRQAIRKLREDLEETVDLLD